MRFCATTAASVLVLAIVFGLGRAQILSDGSVVRKTAEGGAVLCSPDGVALQRTPDGGIVRSSGWESLVIDASGEVRVEEVGPDDPDPCRNAFRSIDDVSLASESAEVAAARERYTTYTMQHGMRVFGWQYVSSVIIFITVLTIVATGLVLAVLQFRNAYAARFLGVVPPNGAGAGTVAADNVGGDIDISMQGIKVSSPVLGVVILVLSMAFLYLYLVFVYPIQILQP